ncbi:nitroreductase family protein [Actinotalea sp. C106]|uniref:nitroreductase family protein n=1 Tax=Actinotalea sp. C106 TaxID=2908644 RepID=UPI0020279918|nr:nitroreductase family protein [Actinotalea sp. C106]
MEFQEVVRRRRMVRSYAEDPVDPVVLDRVVANALRAPSAGFSQGWGFLVLDTPQDVARFWRATTPRPAEPIAAARPPSRWLRGMSAAPVVVVPLSDESAYRRRYAERDKPGRTWPVPYWHVDTGMAAFLILQSAVDAGLGACFFGIPEEQVDTFRQEFAVPGTHVPVGAVTLGHPARDEEPGGSPTRRPRRPVAEVVHRGQWGAGPSRAERVPGT